MEKQLELISQCINTLEIIDFVEKSLNLKRRKRQV